MLGVFMFSLKKLKHVFSLKKKLVESAEEDERKNYSDSRVFYLRCLKDSISNIDIPGLDGILLSLPNITWKHIVRFNNRILIKLLPANKLMLTVTLHGIFSQCTAKKIEIDNVLIYSNQINLIIAAFSALNKLSAIVSFARLLRTIEERINILENLAQKYIENSSKNIVTLCARRQYFFPYKLMSVAGIIAKVM